MSNSTVGKYRWIYDTISLYEFTMILSLTILGASTKNLYILSIVALLFAKQIPEKLVKYSIRGDFGDELNQRPYDAKNCNMINEGGRAVDRPGFPSGHSTVAYILLTIAVYEWIQQQKGLHGTPPILIFILLFFALAVPFARVQSHCHTIQQVLGGAILGIVIGLIFCIFIDRKWLAKYPQFSSGKRKFISIFM
jgi:membrane-associated phospholipid phosphatase